MLGYCIYYQGNEQDEQRTMYKDDRTIQARTLSHSELAMRAAKGMRRSRHKEKTGRVICQHLLKMLASANDSAPGGSGERRGPSEEPKARKARKEPKENTEQMPLGF